MSPASAPLALIVEGLTKLYPGPGSTDPLRAALRSLLGRSPVGELALDAVGFEVPRGTALGIVGRNGSGKSTLLKILAGAVRPTHGRVESTGRIGSLLDLTSGINPDFSGRENSLLLGMLAGESRREVRSRMTAIREFSGLGDAFERPVKSYSAGMVLRLGFSAAIHTDPDILLIDEALAVGDAFFQQRCLRRLRKFREAGKTILLVSHDPSAILSLCDQALWLEHGRIEQRGAPADVIRHYLAARYRDDCAIEAPLQPGADALPLAEDAEIEWPECLGDPFERFGDGRARITGLAVRDATGRALDVTNAGEHVVVVIEARAETALDSPIIGFTLRNRLGDVVTASNTDHEDAGVGSLGPGETVVVEFGFRWPCFTSGDFALSPAIANGTVDAHAMCDWVENARMLRGENPRGLFGAFSLEDVEVRRNRGAAGDAVRADPQPSEPVQVLGVIERPAGDRIAAGDLTSDRRLFVEGWAFSSTGEALRIRGRVQGAAGSEVSGSETCPDDFREDVAQAHPSADAAGRSGFAMLVDVPSNAGRARLRVEAVSRRGVALIADSELELPEASAAAPSANDSAAREIPRRARTRAEGRPRILFVSHNFNLEGAPRSLLEVASRLNGERYECQVLSPGDGPLRASWQDRGIPSDVEPSPSGEGSLDDYAAAIRRTAALRSAFRPDLVLINTLDAFWGVDLAHDLRVPCIWIIRESESPETYFLKRLPTAIAEQAGRAFSRATSVVFVSKATQRMFEPVLSPGQSRVIHNGLDSEEIDQVRSRASAPTVRGELGLPRLCPILLNVGTPCQRKGQLLLLEAMAGLAPRDRAPHGVFVGMRPGPYQDAMVDTIDSLGLREQVRLVNETQQPLPYYHAADLLVGTSFQESLPRVILEGMAFARPIVATSVHGIPELIRDEREGLLYPAGDAVRLAGALERILDDPALAERLGTAARERFERDFTLEQTASQFASLVDEVLSRDSGLAAPSVEARA